MNLEEFEVLLKNHDWYYDFSDDHRVWQRGKAKGLEIVAARQELAAQGFDNQAEELYNKYCPFR